jgi:hypothetical protein
MSARDQAIATLRSLEERLQAVEERLQAVEARPDLQPSLDRAHGRLGQLERRPGSDTMTPNTSRLNAAGEVETEGVGAWIPLVLGAKVQASTTVVEAAPAARIEGNRVFLRGALEIKTGEELKAGETLATLGAAGQFPKTLQTAGGDFPISIAGVISCFGALAAKSITFIDSFSFPLS